MKKKELLPAALFIFFVFCMLTQDIALQQYFGTIAKTPVVFVAPLIFFLLLIAKGHFVFDAIIKYYLAYALMGIAIAAFMLCYTVLFVTNGDMNIYTEFMPVKLVKTSFYNITYFFAIYNLFVLAKHLSLNTILILLQVLLFFLIMVGLLQFFTGLKIPFINFTPADGGRLSLTASEPSSAAPMFLTLSAMVVALRIELHKSRLSTIAISAASFLVLILINSKGLILLIPVAVLISIRKSLNFKVVAIASLAIIPVIFIIVYRVVPLLVKDVSDFNSFSTRVTTLAATVKSLYHYPFGEGYGTYMLYYSQLLMPTYNQIVSIVGLPLGRLELAEMVETGKNLAAKSGFANEMIYNGVFAIIFLVLVCRYFNRMVKAMTNKIVRHIFLSTGILLLLVFLFASVLETAYFYLLLFVVGYKIKVSNVKVV